MTSVLAADLARNLRRRRRERGWTLEQLAERSGVARTTLVNAEAGRGNPTLGVVAALAAALGLAATDLIAAGSDAERTRVIRAGEGAEIGDYGRGSHILEAVRVARGSLEFFDIRLDATHDSVSSGHGPGAVEHAFVIEGAVALGTPDDVRELGAGDYVRYAADGRHVWRCSGPAPARVIVALAVPFGDVVGGATSA